MRSLGAVAAATALALGCSRGKPVELAFRPRAGPGKAPDAALLQVLRDRLADRLERGGVAGTVTVDGQLLRVVVPPGTPGPELDRLRRVLPAPGRVEFRASDGDGLAALVEGRALPGDPELYQDDFGAELRFARRADAEAAARALASAVPAGEALMIRPASAEGEPSLLHLLRAPAFDNRVLSRASVSSLEDRAGGPRRPIVVLVLRDEARSAFASFSRDLLGKRLAVVVDGKVLAVPIVQSEIPGPEVQITLGPSRADAEQAQVLGSVLGHEPLPSRLELVGERTLPAAR